MSGFTRSSMPEWRKGRLGMKIALAASMILVTGVAEAADYDGQWARGDGNAKVSVAPCGSDICATNTWIRPGTGKEKKGDKLVMTIKRDADGVYSGTAFDPQRDMTYRLTLTVNGNKMTTKGCIAAGLLCRGVDWTRIDTR